MADYYMLIGDPISAYNIYEGFLTNKRINIDNYLQDLVRSAIKGKVEDKLEKKLIEESNPDWNDLYEEVLEFLNNHCVLQFEY